MDINYLTIFIAAAAAMIVGGLWYSQLLFGKTWMREMGKDPQSMKGMAFPIPQMLIQFVASLVMAYVLAFFSFALAIADTGEAVTLAAWVWLGFFVTSQLGSVLWEGRSWKLYFINIAHWLVALVVMALVIGLWL